MNSLYLSMADECVYLDKCAVTIEYRESTNVDGKHCIYM